MSISNMETSFFIGTSPLIKESLKETNKFEDDILKKV